MANVIMPGFLYWDGFKYITTPVVPPGGNSITTLEGDVLAFGPGPAEATVVGIRDITVPVPSSNFTVLQYNNGAYNWAAVGASGITALMGDVSAAGAGSVAAVVEGLKNIAVPTPSGTNTVLQYNSGAYSWATIVGGITQLTGQVTTAAGSGSQAATITPGTSAQVLMTNGTPTTTWTTLSGDVTVNATGNTTVGKIQGVAISGTPSTGEVLTATSSSAAAWAPPTAGPFANLLYVSQNGNDTTGDGSFSHPFATYNHSAAVATSDGAAGGNLYAVMFGPGTYSENIVLVPWVSLCGIDTGESTILNGSLGIGSPWAGDSGFTAIVSNCDVVGAVDIDALAVGSGGFSSVQFINCYISAATFTSEGTGGSSGFFLYCIDCTFDGTPAVISDVGFVTANCNFYDDGTCSLTLSAPTYGAEWNSFGGALGGPLTVDGYTQAAIVDIVGTSVKGVATLNGTQATYTSTIPGVPSGGVVYNVGATSAQYTILGELPVANLTTGTNGQVLTMVSGTPAWAASGGGGGTNSTFPSVSGAVPTAAGNLTLALQANGNISLQDNSVFTWDNGARPGFYWTNQNQNFGNTAFYNASNASVGGNPTIDFVEIVDYNQSTYSPGASGAGGILSNLDTFLFYSQWTMGAACLFTGSQAFNPSEFFATPTFLTATQGGGSKGPALVCGLSSGLLVFGVWYTDLNGATWYAATPGVVASLPHYVVATFSGGVLSISVDGGSVATSGPNPLMLVSNFIGEISFVACATDESESAEFVGSIVEIDCWNRALTPTEVGKLNTYYASLI
jgi:hypothetical protein